MNWLCYALALVAVLNGSLWLAFALFVVGLLLRPRMWD
jgi:hypothetical protein